MLQQPSAIMPSRRRCGAWKQLRLGLCAVMLTLILCPPLPCLCQFPPYPPVKTVIQPPLFEGKVRGGFCAPPSHHTAPSAHVFAFSAVPSFTGSSGAIVLVGRVTCSWCAGKCNRIWPWSHEPRCRLWQWFQAQVCVRQPQCIDQGAHRHRPSCFKPAAYVPLQLRRYPVVVVL